MRGSHGLAWQELVHRRSAAFGRLLCKFIRTGDRQLRAEAAEFLAWLGLDSLIPQVVRLLSGADMLLVARAARGASLAAHHGHASREYRQRVLQALEPLLAGERRVPRTPAGDEALREAARASVAVAWNAAIRLMTSDRCLRPRNRALRAVLALLDSEREDHPSRMRRRSAHPALLWAIFEAAREGKSRPADSDERVALMSQVLLLTADGDPVRTRREARALIEAEGAGWTWAKDTAKRALRRCKRVPEPDGALRWMERHPRRLSQTAEGVLRAYELAEHVNTDGFPLYFHNLGNHWREALTGLRELGLTTPAKSLQEGARVCGLSGRGAARRVSFERLTPAKQERLESIGQAFERGNDRVLRAVERYLDAHPDRFSLAFR